MSLGKIIQVFTRIEIDENSGILLVGENVSPGRIRAVRVWNLLEPIVVFGAIMGIVWGSMLDERLPWVKPSLGAILVWVLLISPIVHYPFEKDLFLTEAQRKKGFLFYFFECRGLGSPFKYYLPMHGEPPYLLKYFKTVAGVTLFLDALFVCALVTFNEDVKQRYGAHMGDSVAQGLAFRAVLMLGVDLLLLFVLFPFMLRLDNFRDSLRFLLAFLLVATAMAVIGNLLFHVNEEALRIRWAGNPYIGLRGDRTFDRLRALSVWAVGGQWSGYVFWGFLQELLFLGIFSVQFSRAFDVGRSRLHFWAASLLSASFFGLIHLPNVWLCVVTWIAGLFGSMYFMQCRNLFAFSIVHGYGGTITNKLLPIRFTVGPK